MIYLKSSKWLALFCRHKSKAIETIYTVAISDLIYYIKLHIHSFQEEVWILLILFTSAVASVVMENLALFTEHVLW